MSAAIETVGSRGGATRPPTGLLLSIGDKTVSQSGREIPTRIDHFRAKDGALEQYAGAAARFTDIYGPEPKQLDDVYFLQNTVDQVLEIRLMAWGESGVRLRGDTNYAALPTGEWEDRAFAFDDHVTFYPLADTEVPQARREAWRGEPIRDQLTGPTDKRIEKYKINVEATLTFLLPQVMGIGTVAQITTKSRRSMRNLHSSSWDQHRFFNGHLAGPPFRLTVRPARTRRFDQEKRRMVPVEFFELVLDSTLTVEQVYDRVRERREALGDAAPMLGSAEQRAFTRALALPAGTPEADVPLRDEPAAVDTPDDAALNRIARLEALVGEDAALITLRGVFGVESAAELDQQAAMQYEQILTRSAPEDAGDPEVVE